MDDELLIPLGCDCCFTGASAPVPVEVASCFAFELPSRLVTPLYVSVVCVVSAVSRSE